MTEVEKASQPGERVENCVLTLRLEPAESDSEDDRVCAAVNGRDLIALVRDVELPFASADGQPDVAGSYGWLTTYEWNRIAELIEGKSSGARMADGSVALLACQCGVTDCWPLYASVDVADDRVTIGDFLQPYRKNWRHDGFGPFVFSKAQLLDEIRSVVAGTGNAT